MYQILSLLDLSISLIVSLNDFNLFDRFDWAAELRLVYVVMKIVLGCEYEKQPSLQINLRNCKLDSLLLSRKTCLISGYGSEPTSFTSLGLSFRSIVSFTRRKEFM